MHRRIQRGIDFVEHLLVLGVARIFPGQHDPDHMVGWSLVTNLRVGFRLAHDLNSSMGLSSQEVCKNSTQLPSGSSTMAIVTPGRISLGSTGTL